MLTTSFARLRKSNACTERYRYLAKALGGVKKYGENKPIPLLTILNINGVDDCLWALRATAEECEEVCRLMSCDFAESTLHFFERENPKDNRPRNAIEVARRFAKGEATEGERAAARAAARDAAWDAARDAAWDAAWAAAWAAAGAAAWAAEREKQAVIIRKYLEIPGEVER